MAAENSPSEKAKRAETDTHFKVHSFFFMKKVLSQRGSGLYDFFII